MRDKRYCDILYAWLQIKSNRICVASQRRVIEKNDIKWTKIAESFTGAMMTKTIAKYFRYLEEDNYLWWNEEEGYYELNLDTLYNIERVALIKMVLTKKRYIVDTYEYLLKEYSRGVKRVTMEGIKGYVGITTSTTSNNKIIKECLDKLVEIGLLEYRIARGIEIKRIGLEEEPLCQGIWI